MSPRTRITRLAIAGKIMTIKGLGELLRNGDRITMIDDHHDPNAASILKSAAEGDANANDRLTPIVYHQLRRIAQHYLGRNAHQMTLQPTALVHEAYVKIVGARSDVRSETHFRAMAGKAMRHVLLDYLKARGAQKRGRDFSRVTLTGAGALSPNNEVDLMNLHDALERLAAVDDRATRVVELRFLAGLSEQETAAVLNVSDRTVRNDWKMARAWLRCALTESD